jgi:hypothetical protein
MKGWYRESKRHSLASRGIKTSVKECPEARFKVLPKKNIDGFQTEKIIILDSKKSFEIAESFKRKLENKGFIVNTQPYGLNGVRITGSLIKLKPKKHYAIEWENSFGQQMIYPEKVWSSKKIAEKNVTKLRNKKYKSSNTIMKNVKIIEV